MRHWRGATPSSQASRASVRRSVEINGLFSVALAWQERLYHRDALRSGRYAALADAEGFDAICFAVEALGLRLEGAKRSLGKYKDRLEVLSRGSIVLSQLSVSHPERFTTFSALFALVKKARDDAMHTGVFARHATAAAIELCIGLEEALMKEQQVRRQEVKDFMVKSPVYLEEWQPVAHARQLMLTHSFSFLPVNIGGWKLLSEDGIARYLFGKDDWAKRLSKTIKDAAQELQLVEATVLKPGDEVARVLANNAGNQTRLWLVADDQSRLCGVLSPFELM